MLYSDKVMDHFEHPRNVGSLPGANAVGQVGNPKCGDIMKMYLNIDEDGVITGSYTSEPEIRVEVIELSKEYASSEERDAVYAELESDPELSECDCRITVPGYGICARSDLVFGSRLYQKVYPYHIPRLQLACLRIHRVSHEIAAPRTYVDYLIAAGFPRRPESEMLAFVVCFLQHACLD